MFVFGACEVVLSPKIMICLSAWHENKKGLTVTKSKRGEGWQWRKFHHSMFCQTMAAHNNPPCHLRASAGQSLVNVSQKFAPWSHFSSDSADTDVLSQLRKGWNLNFLDFSLLSLYTQRCLAQPAQLAKLSLDLCPTLSLVRNSIITPELC